MMSTKLRRFSIKRLKDFKPIEFVAEPRLLRLLTLGEIIQGTDYQWCNISTNTRTDEAIMVGGPRCEQPHTIGHRVNIEGRQADYPTNRNYIYRLL